MTFSQGSAQSQEKCSVHNPDTNYYVTVKQMVVALGGWFRKLFLAQAHVKIAHSHVFALKQTVKKPTIREIMVTW
jgi:hypothetical protein